MNIGIIGLGLIGGSLAKAFSTLTDNTVYGFDNNLSVMLQAKMCKSIDVELTEDNISVCDVIFVSLYPALTIEFIKNNIKNFKTDCIIFDCCGVKKVICDELFPFCKENNILFIGGHPMAGREISGFKGSKSTLFKDASFIITPPKEITIEQLQFVKELLFSIGINNLQVSTPENHDEIIALTSQLAHIVSSAYVKSPTAQKFKGFSAGSFKDMTRVAKLNPEMWTELFFDNKENLLFEINGIIERLTEYKNALEMKNTEQMKDLLAKGNEIKCSIR